MALVLIARIKPILLEIEERVVVSEGQRLVARVDPSHLLKSPASVLDKMTRNWKGGNPECDFDSLPRTMEDLARFRIVTNFLSDAKAVAKALESCYGPTTNARSAAQQALANEFTLKGGRCHNGIELPPGERKKGERCIKAHFSSHPRFGEVLMIEVQIQTLLQEAWDKKDHYLIYEPRRSRGHVHPEHERRIFAMSELLWVADVAFDGLRRDILSRRRKREGKP
jgi:ppGpp synthetase/RelA/SpoT-type nucleotidyltranferase